MAFLQYKEPSIVEILILVSFFLFLGVSSKISGYLLRAHILGPIVVGIIYGRPLADILEADWQSTFLTLGYIGLILVIFEGGLTARLDLLKRNFVLACFAAAVGVIVPIGFTYLLLYLGFGYNAVACFIIGAALSTTSLGTTFAVISGASKDVDLSQTRVGAVLVSAAVIDDVSGLVMSSVIHDLGSIDGNSNLGWIIGRPILASALMAMLTPLIGKYVLAPFFRKFIEHHFAQYDHTSNIILMVLILCAFITIAAYAGTSILFGAFLAGAFLTYLPSKHKEGPFSVLTREEGEKNHDKSPTFAHTFEYYLKDVQAYLMEPLFFASIGFAVPFIQLWTGNAIWKGVVYALLMLLGKLAVSLVLPIDGEIHKRRHKRDEGGKASLRDHIPAAGLLGSAMVARGEIGFLIVQIGYNETRYLSEIAFIVGIWAILLNTIVGPIVVGILVKYVGKNIVEGPWGTVDSSDDEYDGGNKQ